MADNFFVNSPFNVTQNAQIYSVTVTTNANQYDYILGINVTAAGWTSMNDLFANKHFIQNSSAQNTNGENNVDISLDANIAAINALLYGSNAVSISSDMSNVSGHAAYTTLTAGDKLVGLRFLEVVATKVFGHAKARAAIANDTEFYSNANGSIIAQIADGINNAISTKKSDIFNAYVAYDRVEENVNTNNASNEFNADAEANKTFNFADTNWEFPIYFLSTVDDNNSNADLSLLNNGPNVGGNQLVNGSMNVPILLRFYKGA